ncbi:MAG: hypothetical protein QG599_1671 [Pseudomonadota bacterium]|nr:hypothetical protein [Pseudomonadota bacterium]
MITGDFAGTFSALVGANAKGSLRYFEKDGTLVLGPKETALRERHRVEQTQLQLSLDQERQRAERMAQQLPELGGEVDG